MKYIVKNMTGGNYLCKDESGKWDVSNHKEEAYPFNSEEDASKAINEYTEFLRYHYSIEETNI